MKNLKIKLATVLAAIVLSFGWVLSPVAVSAEETTLETSESVSVEEIIEETENVENEGVFEQKTYIFEEDEAKLELTLLNKDTAEGKIYVYGTYTATVVFNCTYIKNDVIELWLPDGSYFDAFCLHPNGYLIEYDDGAYIPPDIEDNEAIKDGGILTEEENSAVLEGEANTFENFLAWAEKEADRYGYGDEYRLAFEDIKNAATTKQVTLSTLASAGMMLIFIGYMVYKKVTDKKALVELKRLLAQASTQANKLNELVDATNDNSKTEEEIKKETAELKAEMKATQEAISGFISGFMHFAESVKLKETKKDEVRRDCTNALRKIDGEVVCNENNENNKE